LQGVAINFSSIRCFAIDDLAPPHYNASALSEAFLSDVSFKLGVNKSVEDKRPPSFPSGVAARDRGVSQTHAGRVW